MKKQAELTTKGKFLAGFAPLHVAIMEDQFEICQVRGPWIKDRLGSWSTHSSEVSLQCHTERHHEGPV